MTGAGLRGAIALAVVAVSMVLGPQAAAQNYSDGYKFLQAVEKRDVEQVDELLAKPGSTVINARDLSSGRTGLHIAAERRDIVWLNYLASKGANPNIADNRGVTPLMLASQVAFVEGVEALIKAGARVDTPSATGETPLISAVHRRDAQMIRVLLAAGANPDRTDNSGRSARDYARLGGAGSTILAELDRGAGESGSRTAATGGEVYGPRF